MLQIPDGTVEGNHALYWDGALDGPGYAQWCKGGCTYQARFTRAWQTDDRMWHCQYVGPAMVIVRDSGQPIGGLR